MIDISNVKSTTNYSQFKDVLGNREVLPNKLLRLQQSIMENDKLAANPIIVTPELAVIDGQHRLQAAKNLNKKIYYLIDQKACDEDIILYNTARSNWSLDEFLFYYQQRKKDAYIFIWELKLFANKYHKHFTALTSALKIICYPDQYEFTKRLKKGTLKLSPLHENARKFVHMTFPLCKEVSDNIQKLKRSKCETLFFKSCYIEALSYCFKYMTDGQYKELWKCILDRYDRFTDISSLDSAMSLLSQVYNHQKTTNKIDFDKMRPHLAKK